MAALLTACVSVSAQSFSGGSGTQFDPYLISNADDLDALNEATNNEFENMTEGRYYQKPSGGRKRVCAALCGRHRGQSF